MKGDFGKVLDFWRTAGAIIEGGVAGSPKVRTVLARELPIVLCDFDADLLGGGYSGVMHDSRETARTAVAELLKKKCRVYGYVGFDVKREWSKVREREFLNELKQAGEEAVVFDPTASRRFRDATEFYAALEDWLGGLARPCGIFAANDEMGEHVLRAAQHRGIAVPDEMVVIGVDDDELLCESTTPTLSSISPDFEKSGQLAAELLDEQIKNSSASPRILWFGASNVVVRESLRTFKYRDFAALKGIEFIRLNACRGIGVADVAREMGVSRRSAEQRFLRFTGHTIRQEIEEIRFRRACELVRRPGLQLDQIYAQVGYGNARSLRDLFYRRTGRPLVELRNFSS